MVSFVCQGEYQYQYEYEYGVKCLIGPREEAIWGISDNQIRAHKKPWRPSKVTVQQNFMLPMLPIYHVSSTTSSFFDS